ncbi:hypothetical protein [Bradyrhizobium japonicum]|uniref:hypothetical protein n=1 Tax=Bradyrhizobium japonicum TaxID=375 RepID=UPI00271505E6|nr:hypothetical protein [Bradyrhizobium japonicum]WLB24273.1 hypothetical protein QIH95_47845 [Bradyrhizobium japonicum]
MPPLTRRRSKDDAHRETWLIHLNDVRIGVIGRRAGVPSSPQWVGFAAFILASIPASIELGSPKHSTTRGSPSNMLGGVGGHSRRSRL